MSAKAFLDSNVLVYAHDITAGEKRERAAVLVHDLWQSRQGCLSKSVAAKLEVVQDRVLRAKAA